MTARSRAFELVFSEPTTNVVIGQPLTSQKISYLDQVGAVRTDGAGQHEALRADPDGQVDLRDALVGDRCDQAVASQAVLDQLEQRGLADAGRAGENGQVRRVGVLDGSTDRVQAHQFYAEGGGHVITSLWGRSMSSASRW